MRLQDVVSAPWAITPEMFNEVQGIYARHCRGEKIDLQAIEARIGTPLNNSRAELEIVDGVAIITLEGVMAKRMNLFTRISGGVSTQLAGQQVDAALADPNVKAIVLAIDSPGGTVDGTQALADQVYAARGKKPIYAFADGAMCSAAYWVGSAAEKCYIAGDTTLVGSIGVLGAYQDTSASDGQRGVRELRAGKFKGNAPHAPGMAQDNVDAMYEVFVSAIARNRGVDAETVKQDMADGQVFIGQKAIEAGLVDGVATLDQVVAMAVSASNDAGANSTAALAGVAQTATNEEDNMDKLTIDKVRAEAPDVAQALRAEGHAEGKTEGMVAGAKVERERIAAIEALARPGCEALISEMKADGKTSGPEAAVRILGELDKKDKARESALRSDAGAAVAAGAAAPEGGKGETQIDPFAVGAKARDYTAEQAAKGITVSAVEAVDHVMKTMKKEG